MQSFKRQYTHFLSLPLLREAYRSKIGYLQAEIQQNFMKKFNKKQIIESRSNLAHVSLCMLTLDSHKLQRKAEQMLTSIKQDMQKILDNTILTFSKLEYFTRYNHELKKKQVSVIYMAIDENDQFNKVLIATDGLIRGLLKDQIISQNQLRRLRVSYSKKDKLYKCQNYHLTLFRLRDVEENQDFIKIFAQICQLSRPLKFSLDSLDISTRFSYESSGFYRPLKRVILQSHE